MFIIEIIPLTNLPPQVPQLLSYFFNKALVKGAVVEILIGNRKTPAIVVSASPLEEQKAALKKSSFQLKKISGVIGEVPLVSDIQFKIALWLSKNYFAPLGLCLKTVLPLFFLKKIYNLQPIISNLQPTTYNLQPTILLSRAKNIIKNIEPEIKKMLKDEKQILIIVPEISTAGYFYDYFAGYFETALIHGKIGIKRYRSEWDKIASGDAEIIIGTRQTLFAPFKNLGLIVVENPANVAYKSDMTPKYNTEDLARKVAEIYSCPIILVSETPDIKNYHLVKNNLQDISSKIPISDASIKAVDMIQEMRSGNFNILSRDLSGKILDYAKAKKKILLFSSRKGYGGALICENCGFIFKCSQCSVPMKVYKTPDRFLICHRCSAIQKVAQDCPNCRSYQLKIAGFAGSQKIEEEIKRLFERNGLSSVNIFILDKTTAKNDKIEKEILNKIEESELCVVIATHLIFSHRYNHKFDLIGIPDLDSLTTIPDFNAEADLFCQFQKLLDFEPEEIIVQTYNPNNIFLKSLTAGNYGDFYNQELAVRKLFWYPPFARLVKLSFRHGNSDKASHEARILAEKLKMAILQRKLQEKIKLLGPSPAFVERERGLYIYNIILKILPEQKLEEILRFVPSNWSIDVDPRSIL